MPKEFPEIKRRVQFSCRLPPYILEWLAQQGRKKARMVEFALIKTFKIKEPKP